MPNPTREEYLKQQEDFYEDHVKFHPQNAFCGTAGEAEMKHIEDLVAKLSDKEVIELVERGGFAGYASGEDLETRREMCESVIDEIDREDFYREYAKILEDRNK